VNRGTPGCEFWTPDFGYVTDAAQKDAQEKLAHLVPHAKHITNTNSGHEIHKEQRGIVLSVAACRTFDAAALLMPSASLPCMSRSTVRRHLD
jgi:hypothetical protein